MGRDDDDSDWRNEKVFSAWPDQLERFVNWTKIKLTPAQYRRNWELKRFLDEPCPGSSRQRLGIHQVAEAYRAKLATFDDMIDCLLGPNRTEYAPLMI